jgi:hypothetical protein
VVYGHNDDSEQLYPAPRNSMSEPHGPKRGYNGQHRLVLARLVWPSGIEVVPARLLWVDDDAVRVEWERHGVVRRSWLPRADVRRALRW